MQARPRVLALGFVGILALSLAAVLTRPAGSDVAMWWPASPLSAWLVMVMPRRWKVVAALVVAAAVGTGNGVSGRGPSIAVVFGVCNGLEALAVGSLLSRDGRRPTLHGTADLARLLRAVAAGAVVIAATVGPAAWWLLGADPAQVGASVFASHGSALLLLLPFVFLTARRHGEAGAREGAAQLSLLVLLVGVTFGPAHGMPLSLVPGAALVWTAMRFSTRYLLLQNAGTAAVVTALTLSGWGPYADAADQSENPLVAVNLVQLFSLVITAVVLAVAVLTDERRAALDEVERLSTHDPLTAAGNRRLLEDRFAQAAHQAERGLPSTLLLLDLDGFKAVNDVDGHQVGDRVLVTVADRLQTLLRPTDTLVRLGGDEFVILLLGMQATTDACELLMARIRTAVARRCDGVSPTIGVSIGRAAVRPERPLDSLLLEADAAMYADKQQRRSGAGSEGATSIPTATGPGDHVADSAGEDRSPQAR